jgi:hypothetical protein
MAQKKIKTSKNHTILIVSIILIVIVVIIAITLGIVLGGKKNTKPPTPETPTSIVPTKYPKQIPVPEDKTWKKWDGIVPKKCYAGKLKYAGMNPLTLDSEITCQTCDDWAKHNPTLAGKISIVCNLIENWISTSEVIKKIGNKPYRYMWYHDPSASAMVSFTFVFTVEGGINIDFMEVFDMKHFPLPHDNANDPHPTYGPSGGVYWNERIYNIPVDEVNVSNPIPSSEVIPYNSLPQDFHNYIFPYVNSIWDTLGGALIMYVDVKFGKCREIFFNDPVEFGCQYSVCRDGCEVIPPKNIKFDKDRGCLVTTEQGLNLTTLEECCNSHKDKGGVLCDELVVNPPVELHSIICVDGPRPPEVP